MSQLEVHFKIVHQKIFFIQAAVSIQKKILISDPETEAHTYQEKQFLCKTCEQICKLRMIQYLLNATYFLRWYFFNIKS